MNHSTLWRFLSGNSVNSDALDKIAAYVEDRAQAGEGAGR